VGISRWRRQDGFLRGVVFYAAVFVIVGVLVLDAVAVVHASMGVRQNASDAADQALSTFVQTESPAMAMQSASTFLKLHGSFLVKAGSNVATSVQGPGHATVTITATRKPHTYVFHYFQNFCELFDLRRGTGETARHQHITVILPVDHGI